MQKRVIRPSPIQIKINRREMEKEFDLAQKNYEEAIELATSNLAIIKIQKGLHRREREIKERYRGKV